ncbi:DUF3037 domain-containing protein [Intrasporangium calvum]|uniref:DUF3037 domain-containing protein n=1 Tax=Intrasporangium calvum (strain ATCC 23552 / DSM 43043 / JCM 3097 / NBRC 12989 / NCIMB 10167 / NRRL B-3866 / 7 KIP) TaxID=710696 RepID=E6SA40_INTC7|nr:DUF3037 domain-containing protein [Intrasporangium calvum]ADU48250.1 hypothetical protein Intca_1737 [Intrasporangium calvum DSM 43043]AXG15331.1 DUF3037 domain-containing protein [Intrasporangium calvum]
MKAYQYVVLRLVPRVDREEFVNVGVVLHCQDAEFLDAAWELDPGRIAAFAPMCDVDGVRRMLDRVRAVCAGETGRGLPRLDKPGQRFGWIIAPRSTVVQPGPVHGGLTDDPAAELTHLLDRLVRLDGS